MDRSSLEDDGASVHFIDDFDSDNGQSDPEPDSSSCTTSCSTETITGSVLDDFLTEVNGRLFPSDVNVAISLPQDSAEIQRCVDHHRVFKMILGSNYWGPVEQVLAPNPETAQRKRVLDMVTAEGSWVQEMAEQFPHVDFLSVDNVPLTCHKPRANTLFEVYDLYNGIAAPDSLFDVVHMRQSTAHVRNSKDLIRDLHRVLKPGGLFLFSDTELDVYDGVNPASPAGDKLSGLTAALQFVCQGLAQQGVNPYLWRDLPELLCPESELWTSQRGPDDNKLVGFRDIHSQAHLFPANTWPEDSQYKDLGRLAGDIWKGMWRSMEVPFQMYGMGEEAARQIIEGAIYDIDRADVAVAAKYHTVYAFKI
ncbi:hypothetical protein FRC09_011393 [Ceratobasidium sp. 395]|nr:hypothetical protein FRC09_011393 [Ceratobasidium sp. 395]